MFDMATIDKLTPDEINIAVKLKELAEEARKASDLIHATYHCFGINEEIVEVWHDKKNKNHEYLTHTGVWQARYLHKSYDVVCTSKDIFDLFKAEFLIAHKYVSEIENGVYSSYGRKKETCRYFREFIRLTENIAADSASQTIKLPVVSN